CCCAFVALCAALARACAVAWYRLPMATAGAVPRTWTLAWVTESVIWLLTAVGNAMLCSFLRGGQSKRSSRAAGLSRARCSGERVAAVQHLRGGHARRRDVERVQRGDAHCRPRLRGAVVLLLRVRGVVRGVGERLRGRLVQVAHGDGGRVAQDLHVGLGDG